MTLSLPTASAVESTSQRASDGAPDAVTVQQLVTSPVVMRTGRSVGGYWRKVWQILAKDWRIELRAKEIIVVMAAFSALAVIIFGMAFDLRVPQATMVAPGVLWGVLVVGAEKVVVLIVCSMLPPKSNQRPRMRPSER